MANPVNVSTDSVSFTCLDRLVQPQLHGFSHRSGRKNFLSKCCIVIRGMSTAAASWQAALCTMCEYSLQRVAFAASERCQPHNQFACLHVWRFWISDMVLTWPVRPQGAIAALQVPLQPVRTSRYQVTPRPKDSQFSHLCRICACAAVPTDLDPDLGADVSGVRSPTPTAY